MKTRIEIYHVLNSQDENKLINYIQEIIKYNNVTNSQIYREKYNNMKYMFKNENVKNISISFNDKTSAEKFLIKLIQLSIKNGLTYGFHELIIDGFMIFLVTNIISEWLQLGGTWNIITGLKTIEENHEM